MDAIFQKITRLIIYSIQKQLITLTMLSLIIETTHDKRQIKIS